MKHKSIIIRLLTVAVCVFTLLSLGSCTADMELGNNSELSEKFMDHVILDEKDAAYAMTGDVISASDFDVFWTNIRSASNGADSYKIKQIGWNVNISGGHTTNTTAYQVKLDNGNTILLRIITREDIDGIAGIYFHDTTEFSANAEKSLPTARVIAVAFSLAAWAFTVWMLIDCARRKIKQKVIWLILIICSVCFTVTIGRESGFDFMFSLMLRMSSVAADPGILAMKYTACVPVGAIVYFFVRKKLTVIPAPEPNEAAPSDDTLPEAPEKPDSDADSEQ